MSPMKVDKLPHNINRTQIESGIKNAFTTNILALLVPSSVDAIEDIEQIFQRLNGQGTPLDNEELAYSMIKAYWPAVESVLSRENCPKHITEARLISMAVRVALTGKDEKKIPVALDPNRIRNIFKTRDDIDIKSQNRESFIKIQEYFITNDELIKALKWIDNQLLYDASQRNYGIPAYLRSSIAWNSRDVFAWLMVLAKKYNYEPMLDENLSKKILALALSIHWFGNDKATIVEFLLSKNDLSAKFSLSEINSMTDGKIANLIYLPISPDDLSIDAIHISIDSDDKYLQVWNNFWNGVVNIDENGVNRSINDAEQRRAKFGYFVEKLKINKELLVYVQRDYFSNQFRNFDPSNKLVWKGHNRPWDYDHILPSDDLNATGKGGVIRDFHEACKTWQQCIGNLVAVDFTFNRSAQAIKKASEKYDPTSEETKRLCGILSNISAYDLTLDDTKDFYKSKEFIVASKNRLIDLYRNWFDKLAVNVLL